MKFFWKQHNPDYEADVEAALADAGIEPYDDPITAVGLALTKPVSPKKQAKLYKGLTKKELRAILGGLRAGMLDISHEVALMNNANGVGKVTQTKLSKWLWQLEHEIDMVLIDSFPPDKPKKVTDGPDC